MKLTLLSLLTILSLLSSCNSQNSAQGTAKAYTATASGTSTDTIPGDTVAALGTGILLIYQAHDGQYWFGGDAEGVFRFDGKNIILYTTRDGLANHSIREIKEDKHGNIFVSTQHGGICKFDGQKWTTIPVSSTAASQKDWILHPDDLWFKGETGEKGPYRYDGKTLQHLEFPKHYMADAYYAMYPDKAWSPYDVYYIYKDKKGHIWFGTSNFGICRFDGKSLSWMYEDHLTNVEGGGSFGIRSIIEDTDGAFWFCNTQYRYIIESKFASDIYRQDKGVNLIDYTRKPGIEGLKSPDGKNMTYFMSAAVDPDGDMWLATYDDGVYRYDGETITHYPVMEGDKNILLYSVYIDHAGGLWLGTHGAGVHTFNGKEFVKFQA
jgi:ligand-binding sensor domain-containing protein